MLVKSQRSESFRRDIGVEKDSPDCALYLWACYFRIGGKDCDVPFCQGRRDFPSQVFRRLPIQPIVLRSPSLMTEPRFKIGQSVLN
jgi:hypothetical protein